MAARSNTAAFQSAQNEYRVVGKYEQVESCFGKLNNKGVKVMWFFNLWNVEMKKDTSPVCSVVNINGFI